MLEGRSGRISNSFGRRPLLDEMEELGHDGFVRGFAVKVRDEIVSPGDEEEESVDEDNDDDGVALVESRDPAPVFRPRESLVFGIDGRSAKSREEKRR